MPLRLAVLLVFVLAVTAGCEGDDGHTVAVDLRTDLTPGVEFSVVETSIVGRTGTMTASAFPDDDYVAGQRVAELEAPAGSTTIEVVLRDVDGAEVVTRRVTLEVREATGVTVVVTRSCRGVACPAASAPSETECLGGRCVDPRCTLEDDTLCGDPQCTEDATCPSPPAACGVARCLDGLCLAIGDDASCATDEICRPDVGCVPRPATSDAAVDAPADTITPAPDVTPLVEGLAAEICALITPCAGRVPDKLVGGDCLDNYRKLLAHILSRAVPLHDRGTMRIDAANFDSCIAAYRAAGCAVFESSTPGICDLALVGLIPIGSPCIDTFECAGDAFCDYADVCPGTCAPRRFAGEACTRVGACVFGLRCVDGMCEAPPPTGATCSASADCGPGDVCTPPLCAAVETVFTRAEGQACDLATGFCTTGLACVAEMTGSRCRPRLTAPGAACRFAIPDQCIVGEHCPAPLGGSDFCRPLPTAGEACATNGPPSCALDHECVSGICERRRLAGESCTGDDECVLGVCRDGSCEHADCPR